MQRMMMLILMLIIPSLVIAQQTSGEITGTIRLNGCTAQPANLQLRATPADLYTPEGASPVSAPGGAVIAAISPSGETLQEFTFRVLVGERQGAYRLGVRLSSPDCPQVTWTGPTDGIVFSDGPPITLEAFAISTQIEILGEGMGRPGPMWVGADHLEFTDPAAATRRLRIRSTLPGLTHVLLQFSTRPFPTSGRTVCEADPPEVVRSLQFTLGGTEAGVSLLREGKWLELPPINFNDLLLGSRDPASDVAPLDPLVLRQLELGAPLYVRALPVGIDRDRPSDGAVRLCDPARFGLPGWVRLVKLPPILAGIVADPDGAVKLYSALYKGPTIESWPGSGKVCYTVTQQHQVGHSQDFVSASYDALLLQKYGSIHVGDWLIPGSGPYCFDCCASNGGWFDTFTSAVSDLVTGAIDWISGLANWVAKIYDRVKAAVGEVIADAITSVGIPCDNTCRALVQTGIEIGLSSMGLPPDLPNWNELKDEGLDYVASQIASQTGIPPEVSNKALEYASSAIQKVSEKRGGDWSGAGTLPNWLMKDSGLKPGVLTLNLQKTTLFQLPPLTLRTSINEAFFPSQLPLPKSFPIKSVNGEALQLLKVPIVLNPNLTGLPPCPYCNIWNTSTNDPALSAEWTTLWYKLQWSDRLKSNPCVTFFPYYKEYHSIWELPPANDPAFPLLPVLRANVFTLTPFYAPLPQGGVYSLCIQ